MNNAVFTHQVGFPKCAGSVKGLPKELHIRGILPENLDKLGIGIVGSRRISPYGIRVLRELFYFLKDTGLAVISGFTVGTDSYAHEFALSAGCTTVAVMPCGCDIIHPSSNKELYKRILGGGGAVVSEFEDGFMPQKWTYPKRNRIIAALSKVVLVVEASSKSGSMITADFAKKYGRKLFSVPGDIYTERSSGTNKLLSGGAEVYLSPTRILDEMGVTSTQKASGSVRDSGSTAGETDLLYILKEKGMNFNELGIKTGISTGRLNEILMKMLLKNLIFEKNGVYYVL
ncbi:DNA protecting protein DprA [candidate division WWE3 bacterium RIFOXYB1_FULL_43_24]|uniref:Protecting protein DprA protein n=2 Tax=Katanobacteria TaxID=422282 RepID=A0A0G0YKA7_UNCKA|nr:MAG: protecting protein DprA protein [candidate division WWE3 bacterium GW2011_GWA1_42_12]KKS37125.1 MAG: protecting protein DprA protein [candidate division WWE3 bacterium GW2011_GWF1_42_14]KKS39736.1 MAG: protecting protein DprA protein [candidate division WWE3 bacterium GW2011_GWE1_42_16]KKS66664.1 MAG: protecting protein DprA protein [candidate division WWE3 bacterium GW2011_GWB1_42_6]OGC58933.1 MAG: DNA protecting protein DprA [candidate division WWE3 bacterium RIFOXYA1_FULL_42_9]OGC68